MTMKKSVFIFAVGLMEYIRSAHTTLETVWLKDATRRFQTDKRTLSDLDLPNELTFHLTRGSETLKLNLKRNYDINPNADIYFVRKLIDGQSVLVKTRHLEKEDVAYYQDRKNGAFMAARCVKKSNEECDRVINGNIRIEDSSYDLRPAETDVTSKLVLEDPGLLGKRYVLQDQAHIQRETSVENKDADHVNEKKVEEELMAFHRHFEGQHKQNRVPPSAVTLSSRYIATLHSRGSTDKSRQLKVYHVKVAVLIDSGLWDLYSSTVRTSNPLTRGRYAKRKIRQVYSYVMNGVNLRYKEIEDTSISINVILSDFIIFKWMSSFPHTVSNLETLNGIKYINAQNYLTDISKWDVATGAKRLPEFDHAMLFTRYKLFSDHHANTITGLCFTGKVCDIGKRTSVVKAGDFVSMVLTAAHELGHSLGANHDGEGRAMACSADDFFIMSSIKQVIYPGKPYYRNPWIFSNCSVDAFKDTLKDKECVTKPGNFYKQEKYNEYMMKQPGEVYTPDEQCHLINGDRSVCCKTKPADICYLMRCTDPKTGRCKEEYFGAARGTECGHNKWCIEGRCVSKRSK